MTEGVSTCGRSSSTTLGARRRRNKPGCSRHASSSARCAPPYRMRGSVRARLARADVENAASEGNAKRCGKPQRCQRHVARVSADDDRSDDHRDTC